MDGDDCIRKMNNILLDKNKFKPVNKNSDSENLVKF